MRFSIFPIYNQIFKVWRRKRFALFVRTLAPESNQSLLDVGGDPGFWTQHAPMFGRIDTLDVYPRPWDGTRFPEHRIQVLVGDGCALSFADQSYDVAFSNSVIEHVGSGKSKRRLQGKFAGLVNQCGFKRQPLNAPLNRTMSPHSFIGCQRAFGEKPSDG